MNDNLSEVVNPDLLKPFIQPDAVRLDSPNPLEPLVVHKSETDAKSSNKPTKKNSNLVQGGPKTCEFSDEFDIIFLTNSLI